ncbi:MAG: stage II sporulation protein M [Cellvibrionaceae bacterium]|nr:stage II sporulation protein M [Cellvibrionaceae bacterium]
MKQTAFEQLHSPTWRALEDQLQLLEKGGKPSPEAQQQFAALFRKVCHFHALAQERHYSSFLVDHLDNLVSRAHQQLYRRKHPIRQPLIRFVVSGFPALVRAERRAVMWAAVLFVSPLLLFFIGGQIAPELVYTVLSPGQTADMESMYDPANKVLGQARDSDTNWGMFGFYIYNNISVAFRTFASGLLLGVGSGFFLTYNGALIGAVSAHLTNVGFTTTFFTFVVGHGSFELTAIVLAGAAGLKLGYSLLAPGQMSRLNSLKQASHTAIGLVYGVILMLLIAAFIEAFWSSNNLFAPWQKYSVGGFLWTLVLGYLIFSGRGRGGSA